MGSIVFVYLVFQGTLTYGTSIKYELCVCYLPFLFQAKTLASDSPQILAINSAITAHV